VTLLHHVPRGRRWQRIWRALHTVALTGMNYGRGAIEDDADTVAAQMLAGLPEPVVFDCGAHMGTYTRSVLAVVPRAKVYAFEPAHATFTALSRNVSESVRVFPLGFSDEPKGQVPLYSDDETSTSASILPQDRSHWSNEATFVERELIELTTIDAFCEGHGIERVDLLKLDIEGAELAALRGARSMLDERRIGLIQFEWGLPALSSRVQLRDFFDFLGDSWTINRLVPGGIVPITWHERWEIAWTTNYLAVPRWGH
jgi:FkbM family methyltransferase